MPTISEELDLHIIKNYKTLITKEFLSRPMDTIALAYILSINGDKMSKEEILLVVTKIESMNDEWSDMMEKELHVEGPNCTSEWEAMSISQVDTLARKYFNPEKLNRWIKWAIAYCDLQMLRPFYYTAYNHEIMRCAAMYLCGESFNRPDLKTRSLYFAKQLLNYQTPFGFWEEGPHHGTSMRYNYIMVHGLSWMYRLTNDDAIKKATENLVNFMATYAYPDGATASPLDGRQTSGYSHNMFMTPGLELTEKGQALFARHSQDFFSDLNRFNTNDLFTSFFVISCQMYYKRFNVKTPVNSPLPLDKDGYIEEHNNLHETVMQRKGDWVVCLSGHTGHIPKEAPSVFRLERQNRIELWHKDLKFVVGGGHNKGGNQTPYANVFVSSGFNNNDFDHGLIVGTDKKANHAMYFVRAAKTYMKDNVPHLNLYFSHATIIFSVHITSNNSVTIKWQAEQLGVKKMAIQIPIVVPRNSELLLDNKKMERIYLGQNNLQKGNEAIVKTNNKTVFKIKTNSSVGLRYPHLPLLTYVEDEKNFFDKAGYYIAILSHQIENPSDKISGSWSIEI